VVSAKRTILSPFTKEYRAQAALIGLSPIFGLSVTGRHTINIKMIQKKARTVFLETFCLKAGFLGFFSQFVSSFIQFIGYKWRLSSEGRSN